MKEHLRDCHPEVNRKDRAVLMNSFQMSILKSARTALERQLTEVLEIRRAGSRGEVVLNSKEEYTRCSEGER